MIKHALCLSMALLTFTATAGDGPDTDNFDYHEKRLIHKDEIMRSTDGTCSREKSTFEVTGDYDELRLVSRESTQVPCSKANDIVYTREDGSCYHKHSDVAGFKKTELGADLPVVIVTEIGIPCT
ncbi:hypothetical protein [Neptuniibacter sp. QD37_11]|uniref:hypothetical protein n=1 Tax=Neptuniibacter sp. QD37_11 TaxID=3398209 RepID=UPI0039F46C92